MDYKEEVKSRLAIEDIIGSYLELKRAGRNLKAKSPFTNEKTASFIVSPEKQIWHDFSSGKGGDIFSFVMEIEGVDFKEALNILAEKAGVEITYSDNNQGISKNRIYEVNELASRYFQFQLSKQELAQQYLRETRKFSLKTIQEWKIGYSPEVSSLIKFLKSKGYTDKEIELAGLSSYRFGKYVEIFRSRIIIPLFDPQGRIIGFTGRILNEKTNGPKYINTPKTVLYDKSRHIFGLNFAKNSIRENKYVVVVEGNLDVITSHQAGFKQVIATGGTAITEYHLKSLSLLTQDIRLCFDADKAGLNATRRAINLSASLDIVLNIIKISGAKDPDELIKKNHLLWQETINKPIYAIDWYIETLKKEYDLSSAPGKRLFSNNLITLISSLKDEVEKDHYVNVISKLLEVDKNSIWSKLNSQNVSKSKQTPRKIRRSYLLDEKSILEQKKIQDNFLSIVCFRSTLRDLLDLISDKMLLRDESKELLKILKDNPKINLKNELEFKKIQDYVKIEQLVYEENYQSLDLNELHYEATRLRGKIIEGFVKEQKLKISAKLQEERNQEQILELLQKAKKLDQLLNKTKEENILYAKEEK